MGKTKDTTAACAVNMTPKWSVLDAPGVTQPVWNAPAPAVEEASAAPSSSAKSNTGTQGRRAVAGKGPKMDSANKIGGDSFVTRTKQPAWLKARVSVYDQIKQRRQEEAAQQTPVPISVTMPDGKVFTEDSQGQKLLSYQTTPYQVACCISQGLADSATVARVTYADFCSDYSLERDGMEAQDTLLMGDDDAADDHANENGSNKMTFLWDLTRPLVGNVAKLEFLKFENDTDAKTVFWHSSAHMMGEALEHLYGCKLTIGPPLAGGFYYDSFMGTESLKEDDCE
jgi:threonyl-tRNA synthetase